MTYVVANTQAQGKNWAGCYLCHDEKYRVLSTPNQIRGLAIMRDDCVYITTTDADLLQTLTPALCGCRVTSCNEWISGRYNEKFEAQRRMEGVRLPLVKKAFGKKYQLKSVLTKKGLRRIGGAKALTVTPAILREIEDESI